MIFCTLTKKSKQKRRVVIQNVRTVTMSMTWEEASWLCASRHLAAHLPIDMCTYCTQILYFCSSMPKCNASHQIRIYWETIFSDLLDKFCSKKCAMCCRTIQAGLFKKTNILATWFGQSISRWLICSTSKFLLKQKVTKSDKENAKWWKCLQFCFCVPCWFASWTLLLHVLLLMSPSKLSPSTPSVYM